MPKYKILEQEGKRVKLCLIADNDYCEEQSYVLSEEVDEEVALSRIAWDFNDKVMVTASMDEEPTKENPEVEALPKEQI